MSKWLSYRNSMSQRFPESFTELNSAASEEAIFSLEERVGHKLDKELKSLFLDTNGQPRLARGVAFGCRLLSIEEIHREMDCWDEIIDKGLDGLNDGMKSTPKNAIQLSYADKMWMPLISDDQGNFIGVDFNPAEKGKVGQIINFGRDEQVKRVIAKHTAGLFTLMTNLASKDYVNAEEDNGFNLADMHFIDAITQASKLDTIVARRSPHYGYFSFWVFEKELNKLPLNYFSDTFNLESNFFIDFDVTREQAFSTSMTTGEIDTIESYLKFETYFNKLGPPLIKVAKDKNIEHVSIVFFIKDFNYELIKGKKNIDSPSTYLGSFKAY